MKSTVCNHFQAASRLQNKGSFRIFGCETPILLLVCGGTKLDQRMCLVSDYTSMCKAQFVL